MTKIFWMSDPFWYYKGNHKRENGLPLLGISLKIFLLPPLLYFGGFIESSKLESIIKKWFCDWFLFLECRRSKSERWPRAPACLQWNLMSLVTMVTKIDQPINKSSKFKLYTIRLSIWKNWQYIYFKTNTSVVTFLSIFHAHSIKK